MVELPDELQFEVITADGLAPDVNHATTVTCQHQLALQPFVLNAFVKDTGENVVIGRVGDWLVYQHLSVQCIHGDTVAATEDNVAGDIVDSRALDIED